MPNYANMQFTLEEISADFFCPSSKQGVYKTSFVEATFQPNLRACLEAPSVRENIKSGWSKEYMLSVLVCYCQSWARVPVIFRVPRAWVH